MMDIHFKGGYNMECNTEYIWKEFNNGVHNFISHRVSNPSEVDDILQEVFLKIHSNISSIQDCNKIRSWVYQIARNTIIDYYRKPKMNMDNIDDIILDNEEAFSIKDELLNELADDNSVNEVTAGLKGMIEALPDKYAQALLLVEFQGLSQVELASKLGISVSGAKSRVQRARQMLKDSLLQCCHFEFDKYGTIINFYHNPHCCCCQSCK
jgi:RNA polymerase sigma-70 factor (ECF subfamily)